MQLGSEVTDREDLPHFRDAVVDDRELFTRLLRLHRAVVKGAPTMDRESFLLAIVEHLTATHVEQRRLSVQLGREGLVVRQVREYLQAHYAEDVSLAQLGALTSRSSFHLARAFSKTFGLPPHAYLESIRVQRARELLRSGTSVVDTALSVGYTDQAHFTHRFRRHTGITELSSADCDHVILHLAVLKEKVREACRFRRHTGITPGQYRSASQ
jgi:AraC-like DNA-binding protein